MKIAIIGAGPLGLEMRHALDNLGAATTLFEKNNFDSEGLKPTSSMALIRKAEVIRIHKAYLNANQTFGERSRLADLFRVVYQLEDEGIEYYEDFDMVVDATGPGAPNGMGPSNTWAINEKQIARDNEDILYGNEALAFTPSKNCKTVMIVGSDNLASQLLVKLDPWLAETEGTRVVLVHNHESELDDTAGVIEKWHTNWRADCDEFSKQLHEWRDRPDYEKAKIKKPEEPLPRLDIKNDFQVSSVDRLSDREGLFITFNSNPIAGEQKIETLNISQALVVNGFHKEIDMTPGLHLEYDYSRSYAKNECGIHPEPGFYTLGPAGRADYSLDTGKAQIDGIIANMLTFFQRA